VRGRLDRLVATVALVLTAGGLLVATAVSHVAPPALALNDPGAADRLYALMQRGEQSTYIADYAFTEANGRFRGTESEARTRGTQLERSGPSLQIQHNGVAYDCEIAGNKGGCARVGAIQKQLPDSAVLRVANLVGAYGVFRAGGRTIAGERAECFRVVAISPAHELPDIGTEEDACYAADGVPLRTRLVKETGTDERVAQRVLRTWDPRAISALLAGFESPSLGR
jgi:hypothetical protein